MKRKSLLKRSLAVLLAAAMAVMGGMWKLYFYHILRTCGRKRCFHGRSRFYRCCCS